MKKLFTVIALSLCFMHQDIYAQLQLFNVPAQPLPAGAAITINGSGFSSDLSQISIRVGTGSPCKILSLTPAADGTQNLLIQLASQAANDYLYVTQNGFVTTSSNRVNVVSGCNQTTDISTSSFSPPAALEAAASGEKISCIAIGDLDNDGQMDIVSQRDPHSGLATGKRMVINYGGGKEDTFSTWGDVTDIELADMDGDGNLDIITTEIISPTDTTADDTISVNSYKNKDTYKWIKASFDKGYAGKKGLNAVNVKLARLAAIDLDHDGKLDILYVSPTNCTMIYGGTTLVNDDPLHQQGEVRVLQNTGDLTFTEASASFLTNASDSIIEAGDTSLSISDLNLGIGDFNGDGLPDIAVYHAINSKGTGGNNGRVAQVSYTQPCDGNNECLEPSFVVKARHDIAMNSIRNMKGRAMATGDVDGDGFDDLVLLCDDSVFILNGKKLSCKNCSVNETVPDVSLQLAGGASACAIADINSDGKLDVAFLSVPDSSKPTVSHVSFFQNTSSSDGITGSLIDEDDWVSPDSLVDFMAADMDGDGKPDLVFASSQSDAAISFAKNVQACSDVVTVCEPGCFHSSNNVVINGNFNSKATNQSYKPTANYNPAAFADVSSQGTYVIGPSGSAAMAAWCGSDHTSGSGNMMMQNGYSTSKTSAWGQVVSVLPNTNYTFSAYVNNLTCSSKNLSDPKVELHVNGKIISSTLTLTEKPDQWMFLSGTWFSGSNPGATATIEIVDKAAADKGNDFAIDDIQFYGCLSNLIADAGADVSICKNSSVQLSAKGISSATGEFTYSWSPYTGLNATDIANPIANPSKTTTYTVTVTNATGTCSQADAVRVTVNANPAAKLTVLGSLTVCAPQCVSLTANTGSGLSYRWLLNGFDAPGNNTSSGYQACSSGSYQVLVTNSSGCAKASNAVQVTVNNCKEESDLTSQSILLYPNPSSDEVTVSFYVDKDGITNLFLLDLTGRIIEQSELQTLAGRNETKINITSIPTGLYYIYLKSDPIQVGKLIKQ